MYTPYNFSGALYHKEREKKLFLSTASLSYFLFSLLPFFSGDCSPQTPLSSPVFSDLPYASLRLQYTRLLRIDTQIYIYYPSPCMHVYSLSLCISISMYLYSLSLLNIYVSIYTLCACVCVQAPFLFWRLNLYIPVCSETRASCVRTG